MLQLIVDRITYSLFKLDPSTKWAQVINFFIYDSVKILLLLFVLIALIGFLRSYLPVEKIKQWLSGKKVLPNLLAAVFGAITPFCSCSSIPIFISFLEAGVPLGVTFSFLIASPLVNEYLVVLMLGFFGFKITFLYVLSGITIGVICGIILGRMKLEKYLVKDLFGQDIQEASEKISEGFKSRILFGIREANSIVKKLWFWVFIGVGLGAFIHNFVPQEFIQTLMSETGFFSVPLATIIGVPMYGSCAAIVPIAVALFQKGFPLGTALAFMMAVAALSMPEAVMLRRAMHLKLIIIFFAITSVAIMFTGYLFNFLQGVLF
ncbi:MAG: permease [Candidatus Omnitrophica bacterium]|jgi:hypothetical protein|nr:permease [Candidatus Omnitrophota bacterium]